MIETRRVSQKLASGRGFTLIEMTVTTVVLAVFASLLAPNVLAYRRSNAFKIALQSVETVANQAARRARTTGVTQELTFDNSTKQLSVEAVTDTTAGDTEEDNQNANRGATLGDDWSLETVIAPGDEDTSNELRIRFYGDGTAQPRQAEFAANGQPVTLDVRENGAVSVRKGKAEERDQTEWEAGTIEQRSG